MQKSSRAPWKGIWLCLQKFITRLQKVTEILKTIQFYLNF
ncbi:hypothetical protein NBRC111894_999 [Sporolactobacillus inulinus]|uniref:Uncharacterized protein n=1 Tax=Sporolactobacillus inulinus TaxID=2078 RepID=A0A4Y1Z8X6_9BACL|nr:hypothetical protein NBRC111894_999 [Sporolactobacillus inulinus]